MKTGEHVLDVAPGTGYSTAILAGLTPNVVALESDPDLAASTKAALATSGLQVFEGPLNEGVASAAPFDVILINGAVESHLDALFAQLRDNGRLLTILRSASPANQHASARFFSRKIPVRFPGAACSTPRLRCSMRFARNQLSFSRAGAPFQGGAIYPHLR
ncbi:MAG: rRNA adenine N-6-methyltransferase family protein [Methylovirgula sp.]